MSLTEEQQKLVDYCRRAEAAERELERWRHGVQIEGDYVCPNEFRAVSAENDYERIADALGFVNHAEGQAGREIADVETILRGIREMQAAEGRASDAERRAAELEAFVRKVALQEDDDIAWIPLETLAKEARALAAAKEGERT